MVIDQLGYVNFGPNMIIGSKVTSLFNWLFISKYSKNILGIFCLKVEKNECQPQKGIIYYFKSICLKPPPKYAMFKTPPQK